MRPMIGFVLAAMATGCGKGATGSKPVTTDASTVKQAQATADAVEMGHLAMLGLPLPNDGGPMIAYGVGAPLINLNDCRPGAKHGPCVNGNCGHKLCAEARSAAARKCALCGLSLGFGAEVRSTDARWGEKVNGSPCQQLVSAANVVHRECLRKSMQAACERCKWPFFDSEAEISDGKVVHRKADCDSRMGAGYPSDDDLRRYREFRK